MIRHLKNLFIPHDYNNHKPKILHLSSLIFLLFLFIFFQLSITVFHRVRPGVLGFASNIDVQKIVELTNKFRAEKGLHELKFNLQLSEAAQKKAADMFAKNYWAHYSPSGTTPWWFFEQVGYHYLYAGENLARDFGDSEAVVKAWLASPSHRDNLLSPRYKDIGVAVVNGILNGEETTLVVQLFGTSTAGTPVVSSKMSNEGLKETVPHQLVLSEGKDLKMANKPLILPLISSFVLTKSLNISLLILLLIVLLIDGIFIFKNKIIRISGRSFIHFSFLAIILGIIILIENGQIL